LTVSCEVVALTKTAVEEANRENGEPRIHNAVVVEFAACPKLVVGVNGKVAVPSESVPQESTPAVEAFTSQATALRSETTREVEDAVPLAVIEVVEA